MGHGFVVDHHIGISVALKMLGDVVDPKMCRKPEILADAAHCILTSDASETSGNFFIDDEVLATHGIDDLEPYAVSPGSPLLPDFFLEGAEHLYEG